MPPPVATKPGKGKAPPAVKPKPTPTPAMTMTTTMTTPAMAMMDTSSASAAAAVSFSVPLPSSVAAPGVFARVPRPQPDGFGHEPVEGLYGNVQHVPAAGPPVEDTEPERTFAEPEHTYANVDGLALAGRVAEERSDSPDPDDGDGDGEADEGMAHASQLASQAIVPPTEEAARALPAVEEPSAAGAPMASDAAPASGPDTLAVSRTLLALHHDLNVLIHGGDHSKVRGLNERGPLPPLPPPRLLAKTGGA
jgi:hypothetical protein